MIQYDFNRENNRIGTDSYKWDAEGRGGALIPLGVADTDFRIPQPAIDAMQKLLEHGIFGYGDLPQNRIAVAVQNWYKKRFQLDIEEDWVVHTPGLMTGALWIALQAYSRPGDKVLIMSPVYNTFHKVIRRQGRRIVESDLLLEDGKYRINFADLEEKAADPAVRMLLLCSPHNPVGRVWTREELEKIAEICEKTDTLIISDEIHADIVFHGHTQTPFTALGKPYTDRLVLMGSPSKTFNVASLYSAYVLIPNTGLRRQFEVTSGNFHLDYNPFGVEALIACYNECEDYVDQQNAYFEQNIDLVRDFLREQMPKAHLIEPEGTYLLWLDLREYQLSREQRTAVFEKAGVKVNDGANYGASGEGFVRVNIATTHALLKKALEQIAGAFREIGE